MKRRTRARRKLTMRLVIETDAPRMDEHLFERAQHASRVAKTVEGRHRNRVYEIKNRCLRKLLETGGARCSVDTHRCWGLLSFRSRTGARLHSHENWLYPKYEWRRTNR